MFHRRPIVVDHPGFPVGRTIARLAGLEGFARAVLVGILPLVAYEAVGDKALVATIYLGGAVFTLLVTLQTARLERWLQRRWVITLGGGFLLVAAGLLSSGWPAAFALGVGMRSAAASLFSVCVSLYIMDYIGKRDLTRNESMRMQSIGVAWLIGPLLGVWLHQHVSTGLVFVLSAGFALLTIGEFWRLRLGADPVIRAARSRAISPLRAVRRYLDQPRLRIAYAITLSRSCFWVALFVYGPIYVVDAGLAPWVAGLLLSAASGLLFFSPLVRRLADRYGTRQIVIACLLLTGTSTIVLGLLGAAQPLGLGLWLLASVGGAGLDVLGNIPFMRSVRPRERIDMTVVFSTWRETSELLTPLLVVAVSAVAPFWVFYCVLGVLHLTAAVGASHLPRRL